MSLENGCTGQDLFREINGMRIDMGNTAGKVFGLELDGFQVGDIRYSHRKDLGENYLLCNGEYVKDYEGFGNLIDVLHANGYDKNFYVKNTNASQYYIEDGVIYEFMEISNKLTINKYNSYFDFISSNKDVYTYDTSIIGESNSSVDFYSAIKRGDFFYVLASSAGYQATLYNIAKIRVSTMEMIESWRRITGGYKTTAKTIAFDVFTNNEGKEIVVVGGGRDSDNNYYFFGSLYVFGEHYCRFAIDSTLSYETIANAVVKVDVENNECKFGFTYVDSSGVSKRVLFKTDLQNLYNLVIGSTSGAKITPTWTTEQDVATLPVIQGYLSSKAGNEDFDISWSSSQTTLTPNPEVFSVSKLPLISSSTTTGYAYIKAKE